MYIEQVTEQRLTKASDSQLKVLRLRFIQIWDKNFYQTDREHLGSLSKRDFLSRYGLLLREMAKRAISPRTVSTLDKFIFDSAIFKFSAASLGDVVIIPDYCSIAGSYVRNPGEADDVDIVVRAPEDQRDETLELKLGRALAKLLHKDMEFIYHPSGPHSSYIPLFDLVLRAKDKMEIVRVKEGKSVDVAKGLTPAQLKEYDEETEKIRENRKKAKWPHKFKPAKYTHPNGHPRCIICGDEETIDGVCRKSEDEDLEKGVRPAFGSSGGKKYLAKAIVSFIPEHKVYVEPFIGGGAVLFAKEPSEKEVINDKNSEIAFAYRFIKNMTEDDYKALKDMDWVIKKSLFDRLKNQKPSNPRERFRKFIYVRTASYGNLERNYDDHREGTDLAKTFLTRLPIIKERLKDVQVFSKDYKEMKAFDSRDAFFSFYYLDPPYPETETESMGGDIDMSELYKFCSGLKGKFILSLNDNKKNGELFKEFNIKKVETSQQLDVGGSWQHSRPELLISNYPLKKVNIYLAKEEGGIHKEREDLRLTLVGTGAMDSPRKDESLLVSYKGFNVLIDAGEKIKAKHLPKLDSVLVCDDESRYMKDAKRIGEAFDLVPGVAEFHADGLEIIPFPVKHTSHKTYGYRIEAQGKTAIYAPEFYVFPLSEVENADVAILEGSAWNRPITFTGSVGGHAAMLDTWEKAKKAGIKRIIFTHIGKPVEENLEEAKEMGIEIGEDGQVIEVGEIEKAPFSPGRAFTPLKSRGGYGKYEFGDIDTLWTAWAQGYIPEPGVAVETKIDGFRVQIHKWDENAKIFSEDAKRDLGPKLPELVEEIKSMKGSFMLDGELTIYVNGKKIERKDMPTYLMAENPPPFKAKVDVFDCVYRDGETLVNNLWTDRQEAMDAIFADIDELLLNRLKPTIVRSKEAFLAAVKKHSGEKHSEGAMCKVINSKYSLNGETSEWAKFKNLKELRVKVVGKESKKGGGFIYTCELKGGIPIGKTYSTKIEASAGDILEVAVAEVKYDDEEDKFTWDNPIVRSKKPAGTGLTTKEQAKAISKLKRTKLAKKDLEDWGFGENELEFLLEPFICVAKDGKEFGNITFEVGDKGKGVAQIHIMGLSEEEVEKLKKETTRVMIARGSIEKLEAALKEIIGDHGAHIDMRLQRGKENEWQGNEVFIGNISGLSKLSELKEGRRKLRAPWKQSRADEPKTEAITGPLGWMEAGARKIDVFAPGTPGATANKWGAMIRIDTFDWEMYIADEHAKKFRISDRFFGGNWLFAYVPITEAGKKGKRIWMISKLKDSDYEETVRERTEKQWVNSPTFAYRAVYGTLPKEPLRGRTDSPKKNWRGLEVDAHLKDEWLENLNAIKGIEIRATDEGKSPERVAFVVFRMEDPDEDSKAEGISRDLNSKPGIYSSFDEGREGRPRIVVAGKVVYGRKGWESWWESLADKIADAVGTFEKLDLERFRSEGIDDDIANPKERYRQLIADLRYLGNSGYPKLKAGEKWGDWTLKDLLRYFAKIVDTLRSVYFPMLSPQIGEKGYKTSYWQCYREARQHMKSQPPGKDEVKEWDKKRKALIKKDRLEELESTVKNGIYLVAPHGELIFKGEKKAILKLRKLAALEDWSILVSGDYAYGFIRCRAPREIDLAEFKDLFPSHRVTDNERDSWWKDADTFYYYQIRDFVPYKDKKAVEVPEGVQVSIKEVRFRKSILDKEEIRIPIFKVSEEEHIVGGIVYEPMKEDVQGDFATEQEIRDACYYFMEHSQRFKLQHKGQPITQKINILENYIAPIDFVVNGEKVRKGSWILIIRVRDAGIWKDIKEGKITGFSMAGLAHRRKVEKI